MDPTPELDPRLYMAAERTFLAWLRTGIALIGLGFVVARFGLFLREVAAASVWPKHTTGFSMPGGVALIIIGVLVSIGAAARHARYVSALDEGNFRRAFSSQFAYLLAAVLAAMGLVLAAYLAWL